MLKTSYSLLALLFLSSVSMYAQVEAVCQDVVIELDRDGEALIIAQDLDGGTNFKNNQGSFSVADSYLNCLNLGVNEVELEVEDTYGNQSSCTSEVTVVDFHAPEITCQELVNVMLTEQEEEVTITALDLITTISENCSVTHWHLNQDTFTEPGSYHVKCYAVDASGNSGVCETKVNVSDFRPADDEGEDVSDDRTASVNSNHIFLEFFPNPAVDEITVNMRSRAVSPDSKMMIEVISPAGVTLVKKQHESGQFNIDLSGLTSGVYFIKVTDGKETAIKKLTVR